MQNMSKTSRDNLLTCAMIAVVCIIVQIVSGSGVMSNQMKGLLVPLCVYSIMAVSLNLVVGILGELSLGHAGFMCVGAFSSALFTMCVRHDMAKFPRFLIAILIGAAVAGIFGFLIGIPVLRLNGDYLAIVTLAFGEIIKNVMNVLYVGKDVNGLHISVRDAASLRMDGATAELIINGPQGITGTPADSNFIISAILLLITVAIVLNMINSRTGRAIMAIRDNRIAAGSVGIQITRYKMIAFTISATLSGAAGALYAHNLATLQATPARFGYNMSILFLVFVVLGGIGSTRGAIIAAVVLTMIPELLRGIGNYRMLIYSIVMIVMMIVNWNPKSRAFIEAHFARRLKNRRAVKEGR